MGPDLSSVDPEGISRPYVSDYSVVSGQRSLKDRSKMIEQDDSDKGQMSIAKTPISTAFHGVWSMYYSETLSPLARYGQCSSYSDHYETLVIAYGRNMKGNYFNDCWSLNLRTLKWKCISKKALSPRTGCQSIISNNKLVVFGGEFEGQYFSDLHTIDIFNGDVEMIKTSGKPPTGRVNPVIGFHSQKFFVWGGFNGQTPSEINILHLDSMVWTQITVPLLGRSAPSFANVDHMIYIHGASRNQGILALDMNNNTIETIEVTGTEPPITTQEGRMVKFDQYLMVFGGKGDFPYTHLFAYDLSRKWWFIFHVRPDGETLTIEDGEVIDIGLFMIPREHGFASFYRYHTREIVYLMGSMEKDPPPVYVISIGAAIASLHHRNDMLDMLNKA